MSSVRTRDLIHPSLRNLSREVLGQAQTEARQSIEDARARAEGIRQEARRQAEARRREILQRAEREAQPIRGHATASAQLEAQRLRLEAREQLLNQVFSGVQEEFKSVPQRPDYPETLGHLIREAAAYLASEEFILHADPQTQKHLSDAALTELSERLNVHLRLGEPLKDGVGIMVETPNGHRRYRNTLETRLQRLRQMLRAPVYRLLRGGSP